MKAHEIPEQDRKCINCRFCMLFDATCAHPMNDFAPVDYDAPVCSLYEPENAPD